MAGYLAVRTRGSRGDGGPGSCSAVQWVRMVRRLVLLLALLAACSSGTSTNAAVSGTDASTEAGPAITLDGAVPSGSDAGDSGLGCSLGDKCSPTQLCNGGIPGCGSNCQCLDGTWQAPCPADLPETGRPCSPENAYCGYTTSTNPCGADNCYCQGGAWTCGPTCVISLDSGGQPSDAGTPESGSPSDGGGDGSLRYAAVIQLGQNEAERGLRGARALTRNAAGDRAPLQRSRE